MDKRIRLLEINDKVQIVLRKDLSKNQTDCIKVFVSGYTDDEQNYVDFNYDIEYHNEIDRDKKFNEITSELIFEDIKMIVKASSIPIAL